MEEDAFSAVSSSNAKTSRAETSASSNLSFRPNKRPKHDNNNNNSTQENVSFQCSSRFKGVVAQQNGNWGAQIYANHQRIWLGTFRTEFDAAAAYDSAAVKLRGRGRGGGKDVILHRNFPWTDHTVHEEEFQKLHTVDDILGMIRDGSYNSKLSDFIQFRDVQDGSLIKNHGLRTGDEKKDGFLRRKQLLFQKELTPSDVGKLNRLVIPKKYAVKYLPYIREDERETEDVVLVVYDKLMTAWRFRYCYWRSSQSFVFTRGWNRFVKEKGLKEGDVVAFYRCEDGRRTEGQNGNFLTIDMRRCCVGGESRGRGVCGLDLELKLGRVCGFEVDEEEKALGNDEGMRIFGVKIN